MRLFGYSPSNKQLLVSRDETRLAQQRSGTCADGQCPTPPPRSSSCEIEQLTGLTLPATALQSPDTRIRTLAVVAAIERNLRTTVYTHNNQVNEAQGSYSFDCSQMVSWVLRRSAPQAYAEIHGLAGFYFSRIDRIPPAQPTPHWQHIARIADTQPGDVIAWATPPGLPSSVTGHVVIAAGPPVSFRRGYLIRVVDSTSFPHGEDTRAGGSGFGFGTMYFEVDPATGEGVGYNWSGRYSQTYTLMTRIAVGRPLD